MNTTLPSNFILYVTHPNKCLGIRPPGLKTFEDAAKALSDLHTKYSALGEEYLQKCKVLCYIANKGYDDVVFGQDSSLEDTYNALALYVFR